MKNNPDIIWLDVAESSNDEARKAIDSLDNLSVVAVRCQTAGRGQGANTWLTAPGENLTFSIVLKDLDILPNQQVAISQITALSVVKFLEQHGIDSKIKLPNDIYVGKRKICGILIENTLCAGKIKWSIVGIGINVNNEDFPCDLKDKATSIYIETGKETEREILINEILSVLCKDKFPTRTKRGAPLKNNYFQEEIPKKLKNCKNYVLTTIQPNQKTQNRTPT